MLLKKEASNFLLWNFKNDIFQLTRCIKCQYCVLLTHDLAPFWLTYTQTLFYFSFPSIGTHRHARGRGEQAREASDERQEEKYIFYFPTPTSLRWRSINHLRFLFFITRAQRTLKRKIEGLWIGCFLAGKHDSRRHSTTSFSDNVAGTTYQMWEVSSFCHRERA